MKNTKQSGFTLVELLVVLAIIGLLAGLVGPKVLNQLSGAKSDTAKVQIRDFEQALEIYMLDTGEFPRSEHGLEALVSNPGQVAGWNGPYLRRNEIPQDPWNRDYQYKSPGEHADVDIYSLGSDGKPGGEGDAADVGNWQL
ncbi:type II secretion system major pseudopilin GspG [Gilvimarinus sp. SDUM040013]|uniref:Type II secretion system core protein G n=1 Tax=Gilvimarinus gilvus TaxID=3058038 RepID=A0ABU4RWK8_9GAMM|nr:type II secretion system major pseudopilin GspG [Gilvimarinus sp. SDUM040013]MDO3385247.1 type II secretion system major pseudopilin GspG [Gilvimarinus sp. SDUM040013]MDX6849230.1 type II secretion system major pseudopilin GspG [Gilvimarinus sp. SDUM040013]